MRLDGILKDLFTVDIKSHTDSRGDPPILSSPARLVPCLIPGVRRIRSLGRAGWVVILLAHTMGGDVFAS